MFLKQLNNKNYRKSGLNSSPVAVYNWINKYVTLMQKHLENIKCVVMNVDSFFQTQEKGSH